MIFKVLAIFLLIAIAGCKGGAGSPNLNLPSDPPTPIDNSEGTASIYSVKEYILPSMAVHSVYHGGFDINVADDDSIVVAGLIKVFDPNLGSYPQKIIQWNISDEEISFNELESGTNIFKTNFNDTSGVNHNYLRIALDDRGLPIIGYIHQTGKFKIISDTGVVADTNIECDHLSSTFDNDLREYRFSCLKNITVSTTDLKLNIIDQEGSLILTKTYADKASMNSAHAFKSRNGVPYVFTKNYANLNQQKNFSLLTVDGLQVLALGQSDWGNLELSNFSETENLCVTTSGTNLRKYDVTSMGDTPIVGISSTVNKTLANCLPLSATETLFYSESSLTNDKGYILNGNGEKILDLNIYDFKKVFTAKKIADDLFIIGIEAKSNQAKVLRIKRL